MNNPNSSDTMPHTVTAPEMPSPKTLTLENILKEQEEEREELKEFKDSQRLDWVLAPYLWGQRLPPEMQLDEDLKLYIYNTLGYMDEDIIKKVKTILIIFHINTIDKLDSLTRDDFIKMKMPVTIIKRLEDEKRYRQIGARELKKKDKAEAVASALQSAPALSAAKPWTLAKEKAEAEAAEAAKIVEKMEKTIQGLKNIHRQKTEILDTFKTLYTGQSKVIEKDFIDFLELMGIELDDPMIINLLNRYTNNGMVDFEGFINSCESPGSILLRQEGRQKGGSKSKRRSMKRKPLKRRKQTKRKSRRPKRN